MTSEYLNKTKDQLITICKEKNIRGYSGKKKEEIYKLLLDNTITTNQVAIPTASHTSSAVSPDAKNGLYGLRPFSN